MKQVIKFTFELPEHESDNCPSCRSTDMFCEEEVPEDYCKNDWHIYERTVELPACWEICEGCRGNGNRCNPNIGAITAEEWERDWDEDEREGYMNGWYDVQCTECGGSGKLLVVDEAAAKQKDPAILKLYQEQERRKAQWDREDRMTRYMESGGSEGSRW